MSGRHHLVVGLHGSGKTTFIAALWHVVTSDEIPSALRLHRLEGDRTHLNKIRAAWSRCEPVVRTSQQGEALVRMALKDSSERVTELWLPDMSGESFRDQWAHHQWSGSYDAIVEQADSVLVFVHPEKIVEPLRIGRLNAMAQQVAPSGSPNGESPGQAKPWDARKAPTQVQLVDLLQLLQRRKPESTWAVTIVVSAWDLVRSLGQTPHEWTTARLPLLAQFLRAHSGNLSVRYCGLSAQGGELPTDAERLLAMRYASDRIELVREYDEPTSDISLLVRDLMV